MKPDVLVVGMLMPHLMQALEERFALHRLYEAADPSAYLAEYGAKIRGAATSTFHGMDAATIDACPNLEIVSSFGVGTDSLDVAHAKKRGVIVTNTPDVLNDDVANLAVALLLAATRNIPAFDRYVRSGRWVREGPPPLARGIAGRTIGIVGFGRIGKAIALKLEVFGCHIAYHARHERPDEPHRYYPRLVDLARDSAALIIITPGGPETDRLVSREVMDTLGPEGILINISRGSVVDETALVAALTEKTLGGAALDVFVDEPNVPEALFDMDNVILQPHQGSATVETRRAMADLVFANLAAHFDGKPLPSPVP